LVRQPRGGGRVDVKLSGGALAGHAGGRSAGQKNMATATVKPATLIPRMMPEPFREFPDRFNMADYFLYDRLQEGLGAKVAIRTPQRDWTYAEVAREADRFGNAARTLGLEPEDRVLIALPDVAEFAAGIFGTLKVGGVVAMVNPLLPAQDLAYYVEYTRCRILLCEATVAEKLAPLIDRFPLLGAVVVLGDPVPDHRKFRPYIGVIGQAADHCEAWPTTKDDPAYWLFTSGSTGTPKAAMHLHHDFPWNCERYAKGVLGYRRDDVTLSVARLFFGYGTGTNLFFPFSVGATTILFPDKPTPETLFAKIEKYRPTILTTVPTSVRGMVDHTDAAQRDLSSLRFAITAGEALPPELYQRWKSAFGVELLDGIGSAETFHIYITNAPGDVTPGSLGKLVPGRMARSARCWCAATASASATGRPTRNPKRRSRAIGCAAPTSSAATPGRASGMRDAPTTC
jgi:acyl-coenzyme A synthetase/AMP-(fatty) acid ligase